MRKKKKTHSPVTKYRSILFVSAREESGVADWAKHTDKANLRGLTQEVMIWLAYNYSHSSIVHEIRFTTVQLRNGSHLFRQNR